MTHDPNWADMQSLLNVLLMGEEKATVFSKAREEADKAETMRVMLFSGQGIKGSQIRNPTGTS